MKRLAAATALAGAFLAAVPGLGCASPARPVVGVVFDCDAAGTRVGSDMAAIRGLRLLFLPNTSSGLPGVALNRGRDTAFFADCETTFVSGRFDQVLGVEVGPERRLEAASAQTEGRTVGLILCRHLDEALAGGNMDGRQPTGDASLSISYTEDDEALLWLAFRANSNPSFTSELSYSGCEFTGSMREWVTP